MKKLIILINLLLLSPLIKGQFPNEPTAQANGKIFSLQLAPKEKKARVYIIGHKKAQINLDGTTPILEITAKQGQKQQKLEFTKFGDAFEVKELPKWKGPFELHLKGSVNEESEQFSLEVP